MTVIKNMYIKTFRGVNNLKLNNLAQINILTGDNNSGKTSILELLQSLKNPYSFRVWYDLLRRKSSPLYRGLTYYEGFYDLFNINSDEKRIEYKVETDSKDIDIKMTADETEEEIEQIKKETLEMSNMLLLDSPDSDYGLEITDLISRLDLKLYINHNLEDELILYEGQIHARRPMDNHIKQNIVYISPIQHAEGSLFLNNVLDRPDLYEEMLEILRQYDDGIISINYDTKSEKGLNRGVYKILSKSAKKALPLNMYGDGMKKAILLMSAVIKAKDGILLLDEFETAIHTSAMDKTFRWILQTCKKLNVQVFLTSHSKEAIDKVLKCDPSITEDIALYTLSKINEQTVSRRVSGKKAIEMQDHMGLELR